MRPHLLHHLALLPLLPLLSWTWACDSEPASPLPPRGDCALAVIHSDYRSTSVSLVTADGAPCAPDIVDSGSRPPGLLTALSGDVVLPSAPLPEGLALLDRYPAGVLTLIDPMTDAVTHQVALSPGFAGNPQDLVALDDSTLLVSRLQRAPASAGDGGSDLAVISLEPPRSGQTVGGALTATIDLGPLADAGFDPMPVRLGHLGGALAVGLGHMTGDFATPGVGRIALVPLPSTGQSIADWAASVTPRAVDLPGLENCTELDPTPAKDGLWVVCSGSFRRGASAQVARSGLAFLGVDGTVETLIPAEDLQIDGAPAGALGFTLAAVDRERALVVALGDLVTRAPDRALLVARSAGGQGAGQGGGQGDGQGAPEVHVLATGGAFDLGEALLIPESETILLTDANPASPRLLRLDLTAPGAPPTALPPGSRTGLPPRHIRPFCAPRDAMR